MKNKKRLLAVLPLFFLVSCTNNGNSTHPSTTPSNSTAGSVSKPSESKPSTPSVPSSPSDSNTGTNTPSREDAQAVSNRFSTFLTEIKAGYIFRGTNFYYTETGFNNYCLDVKVKADGYEFYRYESSQTEDANRDNIYIHYYYTYDPTAAVPYVSEPILGIDNKVDYSPAPLGDSSQYIPWGLSSYINLFDDLSLKDFVQEEDRFTLSAKRYDYASLTSHLAEQFWPKNPGRKIKSFAFLYNQEKKSFDFELIFDSFGLNKETMTVTGSVTPGDSFTFDGEVKPTTEPEKPKLQAAFDKLKNHHYSFIDTMLMPNEDATDLVMESRNSGKTDGKSMIINTTTDDMDMDFLYLDKGNGTVQQAIKIDDEYYAYLDPVKADISSLLPSFDISSSFFNETDDNIFVYNKKAFFSKSQTYNLSGEGMVLSEMTITLLDDGVKFNINFSYPQRTEEIIYTYSDEEITNTTSIKETTDGMKLSTLVGSYQTVLKEVEDLVGGKDNFDLIPVLGGKYSVAGLYHSDGVDDEGNETGSTYYAIEYRLPTGYGYQAITSFETKLESLGFIPRKDKVGEHYNGDTYQKPITKNGEAYLLELEVGYSSSTLAVAINAIPAETAEE